MTQKDEPSLKTFPNNGNRWDMIHWKIDFEAKFLRECKACDKPSNCWLGCKVKFSVKDILG